jgi:signal transduction histidine kinase
VIRDISDRKRIESAQQLIADAGKAMVTTLHIERTLESLARCIVQCLADFCVIELLDDDNQARRKVALHRDPDMQDLLRQCGRGFASDRAPVGIGYVIKTGEPELVSEVSDAWLAAATDEPEQVEVTRQLGPQSIVIAPMIAGGRTLGAVLIASTTGCDPYGPNDLTVAEELAGRAALAVDNARLYAESQRATVIRDEVLRVVAHDLRNPLNTISLSAELLGRLTPATEDAEGIAKEVAVIRRSTARATRLIQDLLDVAKMQAGKLSVQQSAVGASRLVEEAVYLHRTIAEDRGVRLVTKAREALPSVSVDQDRILQVFSNLLGNAIKFTPRGSDISVEAQRVDGNVQFAVEDHGAGIPKEQIPHLFDPFWQAKQRSKEGAGLGLAICKGLIEAHGGHIWVESAPGQGSTFYFTLPVATSDDRRSQG